MSAFENLDRLSSLWVGSNSFSSVVPGDLFSKFGGKFVADLSRNNFAGMTAVMAREKLHLGVRVHATIAVATHDEIGEASCGSRSGDVIVSYRLIPTLLPFGILAFGGCSAAICCGGGDWRRATIIITAISVGYYT